MIPHCHIEPWRFIMVARGHILVSREYSGTRFVHVHSFTRAVCTCTSCPDFQEIPVKKKIESKTALTRASSEQPSGWPTAVALVDPVVAFSRDLCADSGW